MKLKFWEKKKKEEELVGASIKLATAERMRQQDRASKMGHEDDEVGQSFSQTVPITIGFVFAVIVTMMSMDGSVIDFSRFNLTGIRGLDNFIFGQDIPYLTGGKDMDKVLVIFSRAFSFCLIAGFFPLAGYAISKTAHRGKINPFIGCWIAIIASPVIYGIFYEMILPSLEDLARGF